MNLISRVLLGVASAVVAVGVLAGCASTDGLAAGGPAPTVSVQPRPDAVWGAWAGTSAAPGADASAHQPPPEALHGLAEVKGLADADVRAVLRADPRMKTLADRPMIEKPGRAGIRPPRLVDLSGDGRTELLVAVDTESGRTVLAVYAERDGKVYPVLFTAGKRIAVETLGKDLLLRSTCTDGAEQAVRYHWDGVRLSTVCDVKSYKKAAGGETGSDPAAPESGTGSGAESGPTPSRSGP